PEEKAKVKEFTQVLDQIKDEKEYTPEDWYLKGKEAYYKDDLKMAIEYFTECIKLGPNTRDGHLAFYYRGLSKYSLGGYEEAIVDFNEAEKLDAQSYVFFIRASAYEHLNELKKALSDVEKAIEIDPKYVSAIELKEEILEKMHQK